MKKNRGFSLIEVIIAITIIGVVGAVTATILSRTYRVNTQSDTLSKLKQNGDMAVNVMTEIIRNSEGIVCYSSTQPIKTVVVRTLAGKFIKLRFVDPNPVAGTPVSSNGFIIKQDLNASDYNNFCTTIINSPAEVAITNKDNTTGVSISNGEFLRLSGTSGKDLITIRFKVNQSLSYGGTGADIFQVQATVQVR